MISRIKCLLIVVTWAMLSISAYSQCVLSDVLVIDPLPVDGMYEPGQTVEFCYTLSEWDDLSAEWFHSLTPLLGPGWDAASLNPISMPGGDWIWVTSITANGGSGNTVGPSFGYDSNDNGNPGDNWGQIGSGPWTFCWEVTVADCPPDVATVSLLMQVTTGGDYETGSWISSGCNSTPDESYFAETSCCPIPTLVTEDVSCNNECDGEAEADGNGTPPYDYEWYDQANALIASSYGDIDSDGLLGLCAGSYSVTITDSEGCVTTFPFVLTNPPPITPSIENISSCGPITLNGNVYSTSQSIVTMLSSASGCDSLVTTNISIFSIPAPTVNVVSICAGQSYSEGADTYASTGSYDYLHSTVQGCDSVVTTQLTVIPDILISNSVSICDGASYSEGGSTYSTAGTYTDTYVASSGCDSVITTILSVIDQYDVSNAVIICEGESYTEGSSTYTATGTYTDNYLTSNGCDSIVTTILTVGNTYSTSNVLSICEGESYSEGSSTYTSTGLYQDVYETYLGCDSIIMTDLTVNETYGISNEVTICVGETYSEGSSTYSVTGIYIDSYSSFTGCDSIVTTDLTVVDQYETYNEVSICEGESYTEGSDIYTDAGVYVYLHASVLGCDSVVTTELSVSSNYTSTNEVTICEGEFYAEGGSTYETSGTYEDVYETVMGCDSTIITELTVLTAPIIIHDVTICIGEEYTEGTSTYSTAGEYLDVYTAFNGCDSTVSTNLAFYPAQDTTILVEICEGENYSVGSSVYDSTGLYTDLLIGVNGCDSIVTTDLSVVFCCPDYSSFLELRLCEPLPNDSNGVFIIEGIFDSTFVAVDGCDSIVTTEVIADPSYFIYEEIDICEGGFSTIGGQVYSEAGIYETYYTSNQGCDSVRSSELLVHVPAFYEQELNLCEDEVFIIGNSIYSETGTYVDTMLTQYGCDSVVTSAITVIESPNTAIDTTICEGEVYYSGNQNYDHSGTYSIIYPAVNGCDSTVAITLIVGEVYEESTEVRLCDGDSYRVGESLYRESGIYYDLFTSSHGCDSLIITEIEVVNCHCTVFTPNAITADGDEVNDAFEVEFDCEFISFELLIFDQWGEKIYTSNDPESRWIPASQGSDYYVPDGIYSFQLQYNYVDQTTDLPAGPIRKSGTITVLR